MTEIKKPERIFTIKKPDGSKVTIKDPSKTITIHKKPKTDSSSDTK